jgi:hypothetical protein
LVRLLLALTTQQKLARPSSASHEPSSRAQISGRPVGAIGAGAALPALWLGPSGSLRVGNRAQLVDPVSPGPLNVSGAPESNARWCVLLPPGHTAGRQQATGEPSSGIRMFLNMIQEEIRPVAASVATG